MAQEKHRSSSMQIPSSSHTHKHTRQKWGWDWVTHPPWTSRHTIELFLDRSGRERERSSLVGTTLIDKNHVHCGRVKDERKESWSTIKWARLSVMVTQRIQIGLRFLRFHWAKKRNNYSLILCAIELICKERSAWGELRRFRRRFSSRSFSFFFFGGSPASIWTISACTTFSSSMVGFGWVVGSHQRLSCTVVHAPELDIEQRFSTDSSRT